MAMTKEKAMMVKEVLMSLLAGENATRRDKYFSQSPAETNPWMLPDGTFMRRYSVDEFRTLPPDTHLTDVFGVSFTRGEFSDSEIKQTGFTAGNMTAFGKVIAH